MSDDSPREIIELNGSNSPNGRIRVTMDIELPHAEAMSILTVVHDYKDKQRKIAEAEERRQRAEKRKAEAAAKKAARAEAQKAKKSAGNAKAAD